VNNALDAVEYVFDTSGIAQVDAAVTTTAQFLARFLRFAHGLDLVFCG